jgi:hypothetical protein
VVAITFVDVQAIQTLVLVVIFFLVIRVVAFTLEVIILVDNVFFGLHANFSFPGNVRGPFVLRRRLVYTLYYRFCKVLR